MVYRFTKFCNHFHMLFCRKSTLKHGKLKPFPVPFEGPEYAPPAAFVGDVVCYDVNPISQYNPLEVVTTKQVCMNYYHALLTKDN